MGESFYIAFLSENTLNLIWPDRFLLTQQLHIEIGSFSFESVNCQQTAKFL
jgi:hypothetical protein